jgi:hypothetical protein
MKHKTPPRIELTATPRTQAAFDLRHTKTCSIRFFKEVMEAMERDLIAAQQALDNATRSKGAAVTKAAPPPPDPTEEILADAAEDE